MDMNINAAAYKSYSKYSELWYIISYRSHQLIQSFIPPLLSFPFFPNILLVLLFFFCFSLPLPQSSSLHTFNLSFYHSLIPSYSPSTLSFFFSFFLSIFLFIFLSFFFSFYLFFFLSVYLFLMISVLRAKCYLEHREKR